MNSSYKHNNYDLVFRSLSVAINPKKVVEIGILEGYSLESICLAVDKKCDIYAYDLFEDYAYNAPRYDQIKSKFLNHKNVHIKKGDYKNIYKQHSDDSIDLLHIDISNNGETYKFCMENYMKKISEGGLIILEGGSKERDNIEWMKKFNFLKIKPILDKIKTKYKVHVLEPFPSLTIIKKTLI